MFQVAKAGDHDGKGDQMPGKERDQKTSGEDGDEGRNEDNTIHGNDEIISPASYVTLLFVKKRIADIGLPSQMKGWRASSENSRSSDDDGVQFFRRIRLIPLQVPFYVYCEEKHRKILEGILRKGSNSPTDITTGVTGIIDEADMEVSFQDNAIVLSRGLRDPIRRYDIREYPTTLILDKTNTAPILNVFRAAAHFKFHLESASNPLALVQIEMAKIKYQWTEDAQLIRVRGSNILANNIANVVVNQDDRYGLTIRNGTDLPLFPYVFYLDSDLSIGEAISIWIISVTLTTSFV